MIVTFFGHRDTPRSITPVLKALLVELIEDHGAKTFYVGKYGSFDRIVLKTLEELKVFYPYIDYAVALSYVPERDKGLEDMETVIPNGIETTPAKYRISRCNRWMINKSDIVITYVVREHGGAAKYKRISEFSGKRVINLPEWNM